MGTLKAKVAGVWTPVSGNGQAAADVARWNSAWGQVGYVTNSDIDVTSTSNVALRSLTLSLTAGRQYRVTVTSLNTYASTAGDSWLVEVLLDAGVLGSAAWQTHIGTYYYPNGDFKIPFTVSTTGSHTIATQARRAGGTGTMRARFTLLVDDLGPVTPAAIAPPSASPRVVATGNALGIVAMGSFPAPLAPVTVAANVTTAMTNPLPFFSAVGRRYRATFQVRAINGSGASTSFFLRDNGTEIRGHAYGGDPYVWMDGPYQTATFSWLFDGDGLQHSLEVLTRSGVGFDVYRDYGLWYVEDVGPNSSPALPIPETPPAWTPVTVVGGWVMAGTDGSESLASYRKIGDVVSLRGSLQLGTAAIGTLAFTLPAGFRPARMERLSGVGFTSGGACYSYRVDLINDGRFIVSGIQSGVTGHFFQLAGMNFSTTP